MHLRQLARLLDYLMLIAFLVWFIFWSRKVEPRTAFPTRMSVRPSFCSTLVSHACFALYHRTMSPVSWSHILHPESTGASKTNAWNRGTSLSTAKIRPILYDLLSQ